MKLNPDCQKPVLVIKTSEIAGLLQKFYPFRVQTRQEKNTGKNLSFDFFIYALIGNPVAVQWCAENLDSPNALEQIGKEYKFDPYGRWTARDGYFHFADATDATAFKLVWG